jgi:hypothetical protein
LDFDGASVAIRAVDVDVDAEVDDVVGFDSGVYVVASFAVGDPGDAFADGIPTLWSGAVGHDHVGGGEWFEYSELNLSDVRGLLDSGNVVDGVFEKGLSSHGRIPFDEVLDPANQKKIITT